MENIIERAAVSSIQTVGLKASKTLTRIEQDRPLSLR